MENWTFLGKKDAVTNEMRRVVNWAVNDGNTYLFAKSCIENDLQAEKLKVGGGNFMIMLGTLATIEFLGVIYKILNSSGRDYWTTNEINEFNEIKKQLKDTLKGGDNDIMQPFFKAESYAFPRYEAQFKRGGGRSCVKKLLRDTKQIHNLSDDEIDILHQLRDELAHRFLPYTSSVTTVHFELSNNYDELLKGHDLGVVFTEDKKDGANSNVINRKLLKIGEYIIHKISCLEPEEDRITEDISRIDKIIEYLNKSDKF